MAPSGGCGTFYAISITSQAFKGLSIVKQHKLVTEELKKEIIIQMLKCDKELTKIAETKFEEYYKKGQEWQDE